jgi:thiamine-phosphate pyrophosphorylase
MGSDSAALLAASRRLRAARDRRGRALPTLWLFADDARTPDLAARLAALPREVGLVLRSRDPVRLAALAVAARGRVASVTDVQLALRHGFGLHLSAAHLRSLPFGWRRAAFLTAAAHDAAELRAARCLGPAIVFVSPVFATQSHAGARPLGVLRVARLGSGLGLLGGINARTVRRLRGLRAAAYGAVGGLVRR